MVIVWADAMSEISYYGYWPVIVGLPSRIGGLFTYTEVFMSKVIDLTGQKFGRLTVLAQAGRNKRRYILWSCKCDCGNVIVACGSDIKSGHTKSCGCTRHEKIVAYNKSSEKRAQTSELNKIYKKTHGMRYTRLYREWQSMKNRCTCKSWRDYKNYGGRGITVCEEWMHSFENFRDWALANGYQDDLTLDRIDVNGNYEPSNCRWATLKQQANNTRKNHYLEYKGEVKTIKQWSEELGLNYGTLCSRINTKGWSVEKALTTPPFHK